MTDREVSECVRANRYVPYCYPGVGSREVSGGTRDSGQGDDQSPGEITRYSDQVLVEIDEELHQVPILSRRIEVRGYFESLLFCSLTDTGSQLLVL